MTDAALAEIDNAAQFAWDVILMLSVGQGLAWGLTALALSPFFPVASMTMLVIGAAFAALAIIAARRADALFERAWAVELAEGADLPTFREAA